MTKPKYQRPRSKIVTAKKDSPRLKTTIPEKIVHAMRLQGGDSIGWIWITEDSKSYSNAKEITSGVTQSLERKYR